MKEHVLMQLLLFMILMLSSSPQQIYHVQPDESPPQNCPDYPCLTLDQYVQGADEYFTTGAIFLFQTGHYSLQNTIILKNISNITLAGTEDVIISYLECVIECLDVTNARIERLIFVPHNKTKVQSYPVIIISNSINVLIFKSTFKEYQGLTFGSLFVGDNSCVNIVGCTFKGNQAANQFGGALTVSESNVTLDGNLFIENKVIFGGAIYCSDKSVLVLMDTLGNTFAHNSGGAIMSLESSIDIIGSSTNASLLNSSFVPGIPPVGGLLKPRHIYFLNNSNTHAWSVISLRGSVLTSSASFLYFISNRVEYFGTISALNTSIYLGRTNTNQYFIDNKSFQGGGIYAIEGSLILQGSTVFTRNSVRAIGGGIYASGNAKICGIFHFQLLFHFQFLIANILV